MRPIPSKFRERLYEAMQSMASDRYQGDIWKLRAEEHSWRRRVGNYRIIFTILEDIHAVEIHGVEHRTTTTYKK